MELAFSYIAKNTNSQKLSGIVYAPNKPTAYARLKKGSLLPLSVKLSPLDSIKGWFKSDFDKRELSRLYATVGRRLKNGKSMVAGLEAASEYIEDPRLRQAVVLMRQALLDGQTEYHAMQAAGFPKRDALVVRSTAEAGKTGDSFVSLSEEISRLEGLRRAISSTFRVPMMMAIFMVLFVWAAMMFIAPATMGFLKQTGLKLNFSPLIGAYFDLVRLFHKNSTVSSIIYFTAFYLLFKFLKSKTFKSWLDGFKTLRVLSMKSDHAALWNSFSLLYDAAVPAREAAAIVSAAASRPDSQQAFLRLARLVEAGKSLEEGTVEAGFPPFVVSGVSAAASSGDMVAGLNDLTSNLEEDVRMLTAVLQDNAKMVSILGMGVGVLIVFIFTYYPMLASVMSNV